MKVKIESVNTGSFDYDSVLVTIDKNKTEIVFDKKDDVKKYEGKFIDLVEENGVYKINELKPSEAKK